MLAAGHVEFGHTVVLGVVGVEGVGVEEVRGGVGGERVVSGAGGGGGGGEKLEGGWGERGWLVVLGGGVVGVGRS